jgi:hypothetical protein
MHMYGNTAPDEMRSVVDLIQASPYAASRKWLTEYGDLEQTGEREWYVAWASTQRLFNALEAGFQAGLVWDAFDNYHDHNEAWTIYGLLRNGLHTFTPKKRYYAAKQMYRFVRPGLRRVAVKSDSPDIRLLAFSDTSLEKFIVIGMNSGKEVFLSLGLRGFSPATQKGIVRVYRTSESENCILAEHLPMKTGGWPYDGLVVKIPANAIFTLVKE